jgi:hypothetical protein
MKHLSSLCVLVGLTGAAVLSAGCASNASPAMDASNPPTCAAPGAYLATNDTVARSSATQGRQTPVVNLDPLAMQGRGVAASDNSGSNVARTLARTEYSRGGSVTCE